MGLKIYKGYSLLGHNTFRIDVKGEYFVEFASLQDLNEIHKLISGGKLPRRTLLIGGGSNLLFTKDFEGTVLHSVIDSFEILSQCEDSVKVKVGSGWKWDDFVAKTVENGWWGAENLSYIPGDVGSCAVQNIGAYGAEFKDIVEEVEAFDLESGEIRRFSLQECCYGYRESIFKSLQYASMVITAVTFVLQKNGKPNFSYSHLRSEFNDNPNPSLAQIREKVIEVRRSKLPDVSEIGSAGSFFKNPIVPKEHYKQLLEIYPSIPAFDVEGNEFCMKLSAGWLIEQCGWKGKSLDGKAGVYHKQALVLVNLSNATGEQVLSLARSVASSVREKFSVELVPEVIIL